MKNLFAKTISAIVGASCLLTACSTAADHQFEVVENSQKNVLNVEWRTLPPDYETLAAKESEKWNFNFRPYGQEGSSMLWSDPNAIRAVMQGEAAEKSFPTALYVAADERELSVLIFAAMKEGAVKDGLMKGDSVPEFHGECFFLPGDADNPQILNWQPFGPTSKPGYDYSLSWMKWDRDNRDLIGSMTLDARRVPTGVVMKIAIPWVVLYDQLPFLNGKKDSFWRFGLMRWDTGVTWGGVVHQQLAPGYFRFNLTDEQKTKLMKSILITCWKRYLDTRNMHEINPGKVSGRGNTYRNRTMEANPHSYMNVNEDWGFRDAWLEKAIKERNELGKGIADFEKMSMDEQIAFYRKATRLLYNFKIDIDEASGNYYKAQIMKH